MVRVADIEGQTREVVGTADCEDQGVTQASQYDAANYSNAFDTRYRAWEVNIRTYDTYIEAMEYKQRALTHMGLKGEENPLGAVVKTAALKAALEVGD